MGNRSGRMQEERGYQQQQQDFSQGGFGLGFGQKPQARPRGQGYDRNYGGGSQEQGIGFGHRQAQNPAPTRQEPPQQSGRKGGEGGMSAADLDRKIEDLQSTLDTDYLMSRVNKMQMRRELNKLRAQRNRMKNNM